MTSSDAADRLDLLAEGAAALSGRLDLDPVLKTIARTSALVTGARYAALGVVGEDRTITKFISYGADAETVRAIGHLPKGRGLLGLLIRQPRIIRLHDLQSHPEFFGFPPNHPPMHTFLGAPVRSGGRIFGNLYLTEKPGGFDEVDERHLLVLAAQAGAAIENALLSAKLKELAVLAERDRISRELHDGIIQTLFSIGMGLESARSLVGVDAQRVDERIDGAVDAIDGAIRDLRNAIFRLQPQQAASLGLARGLAELAREYEVNALVRPVLDIEPGIDERVPQAVVPDLLAVVREALSNCAKHAGAWSVTVHAAAAGALVEVTVADDGAGFDPQWISAGRGLDNMRERAAVLGGDLQIGSAPGRGTSIRLRVPVERADRP